jgi:uncharacterized protein YbbK (DUF523 family)
MEIILISKCLLGTPCRYKGEGNLNLQMQDLGLNHNILAICPEQEAGLSTPREPCDVVNGRVIGRVTGNDLTDKFKAGAERVLDYCRKMGITRAYLVGNSPSCGKNYGLTAKLLERNGIEVIEVKSVNDENRT